jgi:hypothetical protein
MPHATWNNSCRPRPQFENPLALSFLQNQVDRPGEKADNLITSGMHLPVHPLVSALDMKERHQSPAVEFGALVNRRLEIVSNRHRDSISSILEVDVSIDEVER